MFTKNQWLVILIFAIAIAGPFGTIYYLKSLSGNVLELWGGKTASLYIKGADKVELMSLKSLSLEPKNANREDTDFFVNAAGDKFYVIKTIDVTKGPGMLNLRTALTKDSSYDWDATCSAEKLNWQFALRFFHDEGSYVLLFDPKQRCLGAENDLEKQGILKKKYADGLVEVFQELLEKENQADKKGE